ncbi:MAG: PTS sugar transporter subunit IIA [Pseudomonadota bacterium]
MELSVLELSKHLNVSPDTIERWIRQGKLPVSRQGSNYRFKIQELMRWAANNNIRLDLLEKKPAEKKTGADMSLSDAVRNGGVYFDIKGDDATSVFISAIETIQAIPTDQKTSLLEQLIERESALSTGIGKGFAIPHPRQPQTYLEQPMVSICFLSQPVDYNALDNKPVFVLFFILCPELKMHLQLLSAISFCLRDPSFVALLSSKPHPQILIDAIEDLQENNPF